MGSFLSASARDDDGVEGGAGVDPPPISEKSVFSRFVPGVLGQASKFSPNPYACGIRCKDQRTTSVTSGISKHNSVSHSYEI